MSAIAARFRSEATWTLAALVVALPLGIYFSLDHQAEQRSQREAQALSSVVSVFVQAQTLAGELVHAVKTGEPRAALDAHCEALRATLEPLVQALADWLPPDPAQQAQATAQGAKIVDEAALASVTAQLRALCDDMDSEAEELIEREGTLLQSGYPAHFQAISQAIRSFEFEQALAQLDAAVAARKT